MTADLKITALGRAVARSGLLPETASFFIDFLVEQRDKILNLLPAAESTDAIPAGEIDQEVLQKSESALSFVLSHLVFSSPEYRETSTPIQRFLPYMFSNTRREPKCIEVIRGITVQPWDADVGPVNASELVLDFSEGTSLSELESRFEGLSSGMIHGLVRDHVAHLKGLADIIDILSSGELPADNPNVVRLLRGEDHRILLRRVVRHIRVRIRQIVLGVPEEVLWMREVQKSNGSPLMSRAIVLSLWANGFKTLDDILDNGKKDLFHKAMSAVGVNNMQRDEIRSATEEQRMARTASVRRRLRDELPECDNIIGRLFDSRDLEYEDCLNDCFECLGFNVKERDRTNGPSSFPDFLIEMNDTESDVDIVLECKSKQGYGEVDLTAVGHVCSKAAVHGVNMNPMITVCHPYVSTDVPRKLKTATNLSVVNNEDLALAMAMLKQDKITLLQFRSWLTTPGQVRIDDLFG